MKIQSPLIALTAVAFIVPSMAFAHGDKDQTSINYAGPVETVSLDTLLAQRSFRDKEVVVEGFLIRQVNKDEFVFSDGQSEMTIELDDDVRLNESINETTKVRLFGEYEGGKHPEIEVEHIQIL
ncbi:NirD/YgiW/YdeI family stress tolerance protein [Vibrio sinaloensis]